jgi:hypothetical protein
MGARVVDFFMVWDLKVLWPLAKSQQLNPISRHQISHQFLKIALIILWNKGWPLIIWVINTHIGRSLIGDKDVLCIDHTCPNMVAKHVGTGSFIHFKSFVINIHVFFQVHVAWEKGSPLSANFATMVTKNVFYNLQHLWKTHTSQLSC